jgi:ATP-dependent RNA helicase RhlE
LSFQELKLSAPLLKALAAEGYEQPTPVQNQSIPVILSGRDLLGCAQTGTGKTAAFALPLLQLLTGKGKPRHPRALVLTPTRELAIQIHESFMAYGKFLPMKSVAIFGGVSQVPQVNALRRGIDVLIATPGRLMDLINQRLVSLEEIRYFVLDEADRMLDMGFIHDVKRIITKIPQERQTLFFSATMPPEIQKLADGLLTKPVKVAVTPPATTVELINQSVYFVDKQQKRDLLVEILKDQGIAAALVFSRTKYGADKIARSLTHSGIRAEAIHGDKSQNARQSALQNFRNGKTRILVATDIAARGIDIDQLGYVFNYDLPNQPETYVHRIGRTGRAGASGIAMSFCDREERAFLKDIEKLTRTIIPVKQHSLPAMEVNAQAPVAHPGRHRQPNQGKKFKSQRNFSRKRA